MTVLMAWKNIWRNTQRSLVLLLAVFIGIWSLIFILSWSEGMMDSYVSRTIERKTAHIQLHQAEYKKNYDPVYTMDAAKIENYLDTISRIAAYTIRTRATAMINSTSTSRGAQWIGMDPEVEDDVSGFKSWITEGGLNPDKMRNPIVISEQMAGKLGVQTGSKVVLNFQTATGDISAAACRIAGLYDSGDSGIDDLMIYGRLEDARRLLNLGENSVHEIAILGNDISQVKSLKQELMTYLPELKIESYSELAPELDLFEGSIQLNAYIMSGIFMLTLIFGIVNTMLMAILERTKELGMLMAIGMSRIRVFFLVVLETVFLSIIAAPFGLLAGYLTINYLNDRGIDLARWSEGMREFGLETVVYPSLQDSTYVIVALAIVMTSIIASIYPAIKAVSLNPIEAMRKI